MSESLKKTGQIINGKLFSQEIVSSIFQTISSIRRDHDVVAPGLAIILIGNNPSSELYVQNKIRACKKAGILPFLHQFHTDVAENDVLDAINALNADPSIHGLLVQLPLPAHIDADRVLIAINPLKDVDGFHPYNVGCTALNLPGLKPCTPSGIMELFHRINYPLQGKNVTVVGASHIVGRPLSQLLIQENATVTVCHIHTRCLSSHTKSADVIITATGVPYLIKEDMIAPNSVIIDVGINYLENGTIVGDVDFNACLKKSMWITPVPGGVGPMTVAYLLKNVLFAYQRMELNSGTLISS